MKAENLPSPQYLRERIDYNPDTGQMIWKTFHPIHKGWNERWSGKPAFAGLNNHGYKQGAVDRRMLIGHRVAWAIVHGEWPDGHIDHINGDRADNRISNLRIATPVENNRNMRKFVSNSSGVTGVNYHKRDKRYRAFISIEDRSVHLGNFLTIEEAIAARQAAERDLQFTPRHGRDTGKPLDYPFTMV
jgi:hypothetical protein